MNYFLLFCTFGRTYSHANEMSQRVNECIQSTIEWNYCVRCDFALVCRQKGKDSIGPFHAIYYPFSLVNFRVLVLSHNFGAHKSFEMMKLNRSLRLTQIVIISLSFETLKFKLVNLLLETAWRIEHNFEADLFDPLRRLALNFLIKTSSENSLFRCLAISMSLNASRTLHIYWTILNNTNQ